MKVRQKQALEAGYKVPAGAIFSRNKIYESHYLENLRSIEGRDVSRRRERVAFTCDVRARCAGWAGSKENLFREGSDENSVVSPSLQRGSLPPIAPAAGRNGQKMGRSIISIDNKKKRKAKKRFKLHQDLVEITCDGTPSKMLISRRVSESPQMERAKILSMEMKLQASSGLRII